MEVLILSQSVIRRVLPVAECIDVMAEALRALARGEAHQPLRSVMWLPGNVAALAAMPAYMTNPHALGVKVITVFPGNQGTAFDSHQGVVILFDPEHGHPLAIADATELTAIRTAAVSGVATRALARDDAHDLAILGSGTQARTHLEAMRVVRPISRVRVWSRDRAHARRFAERQSNLEGLAVEPAETPREAVAGADLLCTVTSAREPVLRGAWVAPGAHINAVGFSGPAGRELDTRAVVQSRLFVDRRESALHEAGDLAIPITEGAIGPDHIRGELGEVLLGRVPGRTTPEDITAFKSVGLAIEDVGSLLHVHQRAMERGLGTKVDFGGLREPS